MAETLSPHLSGRNSRIKLSSSSACSSDGQYLLTYFSPSEEAAASPVLRNHQWVFSLPIILVGSSVFSPSSGSYFSERIEFVAGGWGSFQLGLKGRAEDPEPGRCRRTDGKKWRCSKKACPDSKYCERHLHRGKNRPRRPLESSPQRSKNPSVPPSHLSLVPPSIKELRQVLVSSPPSLAVKRLMNEASRCCHGHVEEGIEDTSSFNINKIKESTHGEIEEEKDKRVALEEQGPTEEDGFASASRSPMAWPLLLDLNV
ncbi:Growth-regulating factor 1 [Apostasia shenzhenica]|uniref:Growth-regulating factor n=1 Tax=Apostasia shenzhenica TaxID=1088818 RepID=A0A2I0AA31_9ASPA|nr:Growth-regulating factor 1 [Apostasia shenzhenica]